MVTYLAYISLLFTAILFVSSATKDKAHIRMHGVDAKCSFNKQYMENMTCAVENDPITKFDFDSYAKPNVTLDNIFVVISVFHKGNDMNQYRTYFGLNNLKIDWCKYTSRTVGSLFLDIFDQDLRKSDNNIRSCPFPNHVYLKNFTISLELAEEYVQLGFYKAVIKLLLKQSGKSIFLSALNMTMEIQAA